MAEVDLKQASTIGLVAWGVQDGQLRLTFSGNDEPRVLRCVCSRSHWIIETQPRDAGTILQVRCHACGRRGSISLAATPP